MKNFKFLALSIMIGSFMAFAAACGSSEEGSTNGNSGSEQQQSESGSEEKKLEGEIAIDGSSTVGPIMEAVSEEFSAEHPDVKAPIGISGTGGGFEKFTIGETDISNASRPIKEEEKKAAEENGIEYTEFKIAFDGLSVVVNKENDWVDKLSIEDLAKIWKGEPKKWSDINPDWPKEDIKYFSPGTDSGTYDYFDEVVLQGEPIVKEATLSEDDNVLVKGVANDKNAIGYFGYAYYLENKDQLKVVPIVNSKGEAIEPTNETIEKGTYEPLSRPLFIYVNNKSLKEKPQVYEYVKYTLENAAQLAEEVGYVSLPQEQYDEQLKTLESLK